MKITKFVHSCLLVEENDQAILVDPGMFSWDSGLIKLDKFPQLDAILITHEHPDHYHEPALQELINKFTTAPIVSNESVVKKLKASGIDSSTQPINGVSMEVVQHEDLWGDLKPPLDSIFTLFNKLMHPGDRLNLNNSTEVLALPIFAPWGSFKWAMETVERLKPKVVIPIHDWFLGEGGQQWHYQRAIEFCQPLNIEFIPIKNAESVDV